MHVATHNDKARIENRRADFPRLSFAFFSDRQSAVSGIDDCWNASGSDAKNGCGRLNERVSQKRHCSVKPVPSFRHRVAGACPRRYFSKPTPACDRPSLVFAAAHLAVERT